MSLCSRPYDASLPRFGIDEDAALRNIERLRRAVETIGAVWRPRTHAAVRDLIPAGPLAGTSDELPALIQQGHPDLLVLRPVANGDEADRLATHATSAHVTVLCDHYLNAKLLAQACADLETTCRLALLIRTHDDDWGVRPGRDAVDLFQAVRRLPGLEITALAVTPSADTPAAKVRSILDDTARLLGPEAWTPDRIHWIGSPPTGPLGLSAPVEVVTPPPLEADATGLEPAVWCRCQVISRPRLERAVIDLSLADLPDPHARPSLLDLPDATCLRRHADRTSYLLGPRSQELRIGDEVFVAVPCSSVIR